MFRDKITISPLLLRLLTLNILILFFIVGGLISIDRYQQTLQENEFKKLEDEGRILSQAIGKTILPVEGFKSQVIITREAQETISYLLSKSRVRIRLFSYQGDLLADSERSVGFQTRVKSTELPSLEKKNFFRIFLSFVMFIEGLSGYLRPKIFFAYIFFIFGSNFFTNL